MGYRMQSRGSIPGKGKILIFSGAFKTTMGSSQHHIQFLPRNKAAVT
jgi:hypothetical protein